MKTTTTTIMMATTTGTDGPVRVAIKEIALQKSAARVPGRYHRIPDDFVWAKGNPGGLVTIHEDDGNVSSVWDSTYESDDDGLSELPPRAPTDPQRDVDKRDSKTVDKRARVPAEEPATQD